MAKNDDLQPAAMKVFVEDPTMDEVKPEDHRLVKDVLSVMSALHFPDKLFKGWHVKSKGTTHYEILGYIDTSGGEWEVFYDDLDLIRKLDYARITASVRVSGLSAQICVRVLSQSERVMVTECDIIRVQKRTRAWFGT